MIGTINKDSKVASYQPSKEIADFTRLVKQDYQLGDRILNDSYEEYDGRSVISEMNQNQKAFNTYIEASDPNPKNKWKWKGRRPIVRNKVISLAAQLTASILFPNVFAQNNSDEEDKVASQIMRDIMKWNIDNSDYERSFIFAVVAGLVNPATVMKAEYAEVLQTIKERMEDGSISKKEVIDEVLSGFQANTIPLDELFITNVRQFDIQKQRAIIRRRYIEFDEAEALYKDHNNFKYIKAGITNFYNDDESTFYESKDDEMDTLVEEVTYYNRREDTEVVFVNGVYLGDDNVDANLMKHRDNKGNPKYPFVKAIYEMIDEGNFFYGKSAVAKLIGDEALLNKMWAITMDGSYLDVMKPIILTGTSEMVDGSVMFPSAVTAFKDDTKVTPLTNGSNIGAGYNAIQEIERSITESSQSNVRSGIEAPGQQTAFEIQRLEQNARINLGISTRMIAGMVEDLGDLMIDIILTHQTVGQVEEILGGGLKMKFRSFLLPDELAKGRKVTKKIVFTDELMGRAMSEDEYLKAQFQLMMNEEGGYNSGMRLYKVNPFLFMDMSFKAKVSADRVLEESEALQKAMKLEGRDRMVTSPLADIEAVERDFLFDVFAPGDSDKYMKKAKDVLGANLGQSGGAGRPSQGKTSDLVSQMTGSNSLKDLIKK